MNESLRGWGGFGRLLDIYAQTKTFSEPEARAMLASFSSADIRIVPGPGDLLDGAVGQRHRGILLGAEKALWPRWLIRSAVKKHGLGTLITAIK